MELVKTAPLTRAEMRMANEIDRGQAEGQLATKGQRANVRGSDISEYRDLGIDRRRVSEWRETLEAEKDASLEKNARSQGG